MNAPNIAESTSTLIEIQVRDNIEAALTRVNDERADNKVNLPKVESFFISGRKTLLELPAVFTVVEDINFRLVEKNPNHINAAVIMNVAVVIEERNSDRLTLKAFRYQDALYAVLNGAQLVDLNSDVKLVVKVMRASYSPVYDAEEQGGASGNFRKEVVLELEVDHFQRLN